MRAPAPFIVGVPRSGTTLLRLMLDAHPDLVIPAETHFLPKLIRRMGEKDARPRVLRAGRRRRPRLGERAEEGRRIAFEVITGHRRWPDWQLDAEELRSRFESIEPFGVTEAARAFFELCAERAGKSRWGDKSPNYRTKMPRIEAVLPEARFIHIIRDGRDVALSLMDVPWGPATVAEAARLWADDIRRARRQAARLDHYIELRYEDLVADPEPWLRRVAELVELPWDDAMLDYHGGAEERIGEFARDFAMRSGVTISAEERARQHRFTSQPPSNARTARWRQEMSAPDLAAFERAAGGLLAELGYRSG